MSCLLPMADAVGGALVKAKKMNVSSARLPTTPAGRPWPMTRPPPGANVAVIVEDGLCREVDDETVAAPVGGATEDEFWEEVDGEMKRGLLGAPGEGVIRRVRVDVIQTS